MICTAMIQVDACGWVVCNKPAEGDTKRCVEHAETHAIEKLLDDELFSILSSRIRMSIAKQVRETAFDDCIAYLKEVGEEEDIAASLPGTVIERCIDRLKVER